MKWPEAPTCHGEEPHIPGMEQDHWQVRGTTRHCSYCGSIHPEDLIGILEKGGDLYGADWKGWPHKFYVKPTHGKWYNSHLLDQGYDDAALQKLLGALEISGIRFFFEGDKLRCRAPHSGYQKM